MTKKIDVDSIAAVIGSRYPAPFDRPCRERVRRRLGDAAELTQFGVNLLRLSPGAWSSQRHWHTEEDEFVFILEGEVMLVTDDGEEVLRGGVIAPASGPASPTDITCRIALLARLLCSKSAADAPRMTPRSIQTLTCRSKRARKGSSIETAFPTREPLHRRHLMSSSDLRTSSFNQ